ncbi:hypothetical protein FXO37_20353 [Capsicum annuum]|nr:hypothetical protein FXO37_20353 [Capsicum annuum]
MFKSTADVHAFASLYYGLLITRILLHYSINFLKYLVVELSATYDSKTTTNMGYVLVKNEWCNKDSTKSWSDVLKVRKSISNPMLSLVKEIEELKDRLKVIEEWLLVLQKLTTRLL